MSGTQEFQPDPNRTTLPENDELNPRTMILRYLAANNATPTIANVNAALRNNAIDPGVIRGLRSDTPQTGSPGGSGGGRSSALPTPPIPPAAANGGGGGSTDASEGGGMWPWLVPAILAGGAGLAGASRFFRGGATPEAPIPLPRPGEVTPALPGSERRLALPAPEAAPPALPAPETTGIPGPPARGALPGTPTAAQLTGPQNPMLESALDKAMLPPRVGMQALPAPAERPPIALPSTSTGNPAIPLPDQSQQPAAADTVEEKPTARSARRARSAARSAPGEKSVLRLGQDILTGAGRRR